MCSRLVHWWRLYLPEQTDYNVEVSIAYLSDNGAHVQAVRRRLLVFRWGQRKVGGRSECAYEYGDLHNTSKVFDWNMAKGCRLPQRTCGSRLNYVPGSPPNENWRDGTVFLWYPVRSIERLRDGVSTYLHRAPPGKPCWIHINWNRPRALHKILQGEDQHVIFSRCVWSWV